MGSKRIKLSEFAVHQKGFAFKSNDYQDHGVAVVRVSNFTNDSIDISDLKCVSPDVAIDKTVFALLEDDVVIATVGSWPNNPSSVVGKVIRVPVSASNSLLNQNAVRLRPISNNQNDLQFLFYLLKDKTFSDYIVSTAQGSANQASITLKDIYAYEFDCPDYESRKLIAKKLYVLDKKITLNRQINQTLEQIAQTLFKSWFVDFDPVIDNALDAGNEIPEPLQARAELRQTVRASQDFQPLPAEVRTLFPAEFEESELGWVPKGWKASNVGNEFDVTMGQSPPGDTYNENGTGFPFFQGKTDFGFRFPSNRVYCTDPKRLANKNDTLISVRAPVGDTNLAASDCCIGRGVAAVRHKSGSVSFTYYAINNLAKHFEVYEGEGTVFGSINQKDMNSLPQLTVPKDCIFFFDKYAGDWDKKIELVAKEIEQLTQLRDTLLPKLISGELRLDDLPDEVVTAANE